MKASIVSSEEAENAATSMDVGRCAFVLRFFTVTSIRTMTMTTTKTAITVTGKVPAGLLPANIKNESIYCNAEFKGVAVIWKNLNKHF